MALSQIDLEKLKSDLMGDATDAASQAQNAMATRGAPEDSSFSPRAFRIGKQKLGEVELKSADDAIGRLIQHLKTESAFKDDLEASKFEMGLNKKMKQYKLLLIKKAGEFEKHLAEQGYDAKQRQGMLSAMSNLAANTTRGIIAGIGNSGGVGDSSVSAATGDAVTGGFGDAAGGNFAGGAGAMTPTSGEGLV